MSPTRSATSGYGLWDVARFLCAIRCASCRLGRPGNPHLRSVLLALGRPGNPHLLHSVLLALGSRTCWLSGSPQRPLAFLYLPLNGSRSNWSSGCPGAPLARNLSALYCRSSHLRSGCPYSAHAALSGVAAALVACSHCAAVSVRDCCLKTLFLPLA